MALKKEPATAAEKPKRRRIRKTAEDKVETVMQAAEVENLREEETREETETIKKELEEQKEMVEAKADEEIKAETKALQAQVDELKRLLAEQQSRPAQIIQVEKDSERVLFLWQAEVADDNTVVFGDNGRYGKIVGKTGSFYVPKNDLSSVLDAQTRRYLDNRWLIVISGLNDEEREALNANYKEGELLDKKAFAKMMELDEKILEIYPKLCDAHKEMVAKRYYEVWSSGKGKLNREVVVALNKLSPNDGFKAIIEEMNAKDTE